MNKQQILRDSYKNNIYTTNQGCKAKIVEYIRKDKVIITFDDINYITCTISNLKRGNVLNPYHPSIYGVGFFGVGKYKGSLKKEKVLVTWFGMLRRCYNEKEREKHPSYKGCSVAGEWHNFQNFAQWFYENYIEGFHLDKDILVKGNKVYSPETCCFVPQEINNLLTNRKESRGLYYIGVRFLNSKFHARIRKKNFYFHLGSYKTPEEAFQAYKTAKEQYIKEIADKWKDKIDPRVYQAMYDYQVEITD